jgi:hypothetical protein
MSAARHDSAAKAQQPIPDKVLALADEVIE